MDLERIPLGKLKGSGEVGLKDGSGSGDSTIKNTVNFERKKELFIHHIDVGQGEATLIVHRTGGIDEFVILIDGGRYTRGGGTIVRYVRKLGITKINLLVCTHHDADHIEGLIRVLEDEANTETEVRIEVGQVVDRQSVKMFGEIKDSGIVLASCRKNGLQKGSDLPRSRSRRMKAKAGRAHR